MTFYKDGNTVIITSNNISIPTLLNDIENTYNNFKDNHIIIDLSVLDTIFLEDIIKFLSLSNTHRGDKKSFVIVSNKLDFDTMPDEICVVPTIQEAYDIIEMEDIERDLGF